MRNLSILSILFLFVLLSGCGKTDEQTDNAPETFIFARGADAQKLDPADVDDGESVNTMAQMFEGLLGFKANSLEIEPLLAERYEISEDGLVYTFRLRGGVQFHDGTPLTAETARFSFDRQMDPDHPAHFASSSFQYWSNLFSSIVRIETVDEMTLRFHLSERNAGLLYAFASFPAWLVSPGSYETHGKDMIFHPSGTGPYRFVRWHPQEAVVYERNEDYWGEPKAGFERMVIRSIPFNSTRLSELKVNQVHGIDGLQPSELAELKGDERFKVYRAPGLNVGYLSFSHFAEHLRNPEIRKAIAMAIDKTDLVKIGLDGFGSVANYPIPKGFIGYPKMGSGLAHNPDQAREILKVYPELLERTLTLATFGQPRMYFPDPQRIASLIRDDLELVGLKVEIVNREFKSHLHATRNGDFEMALLGWIADTPDPDNFLGTFLHSKAAVKGSATNISFYKNEGMDRLLDEGTIEIDLEKRQLLYEEALKLWAEDLPIIPLVHGDQITVLRKEIGGYDLHPVGNHFFGPIFWKP